MATGRQCASRESMGAGSRNKGASAEREVADLLQSWWSPVEAGCRFVRTPLSGGWGGKDLRRGFRASGDLMTTAEKFPFVVEVKRREKWSMDTLLAGKRSPVWGWWEQAVAAADEQDAVPLMIFRKSREPWYAMLPREWAKTLLQPWATWSPRMLRASGVCYAMRLPWMVTLDFLLTSNAHEWVR